MNRKLVLAFLLGAVVASVVSVLIQSQKSPAVSAPAVAANPAHPVMPLPATAMPATTMLAATMSSTAMPTGDGKAGSIDTLTERLRARLEKEPNDVNGWVLLARSYHYLQRWDEAKAAFAKAKSLGYLGDEDQAPVNEGAATAVNSNGGTPDPVFESVARTVQQQSSQLNTPPVAAGQGK